MIFSCSKFPTKDRKRILTQAELQYYADHLDEISDLEEDPFHSSDESEKDKDYEPGTSDNSSLSDSELQTAMDSTHIEDNDDDDGDESRDETGTPSEEQEWQSDDEDPPDIPFFANAGININMENNTAPIDFFHLLFPDELINIIVQETNRRAHQKETAPRTRSKIKKLNKWKDLTNDEFKKFLGLCCLGGNIQFPTMASRWSHKPLYYHPIYSQTMPRNRFENILENLRFVDHSAADMTDRLYKIRPIMSAIQENIKKVLVPERNLSLDESMIPWRGRLSFRQYIKNKSHKYGLKLYVLTTHDGFVLNFVVYTGKGTLATGESTHTEQVVKQLMKNYLDQGYWLYMDNFYNSVKLAEDMIKRKTYVTGTLRENRKGNPKELFKRKLKKSEAVYKRKGPVLVTNWKDKRCVRMISTGHRHAMVEVQTKRGNKLKPICIADYNKYMSGIDRSDQMMAYYSTLKKTIRWYRKVFFHLVDLCIWDAYYLYKKVKDDKCRLLSFREEIISSLIGSDKHMVQHTAQKDQSQDTTLQHYLEPIPDTASNKNVMRRCKNCTKNNTRKQTRYLCPLCQDSPALCVHPCFRQWHEK